KCFCQASRIANSITFVADDGPVRGDFQIRKFLRPVADTEDHVIGILALSQNFGDQVALATLGKNDSLRGAVEHVVVTDCASGFTYKKARALRLAFVAFGNKQEDRIFRTFVEFMEGFP